MTKFLVEVEQLDRNDNLILWMGECDDEGEMQESTQMGGVIEDVDGEYGSTGIATFVIDWDTLVDFVVRYAPEDIPLEIIKRAAAKVEPTVRELKKAVCDEPNWDAM